MLEDLDMDKKNSNRPQGSSNKPGTEPKKTPESQVNNGKQFPRSSRKREREPAGGGFTSKNEQKRAVPQKNKIGDKRPRPRGFNYGSRKEDSQMSVEELEAEFGSLFNIGSKKQSLNHLLNFHYEPRGVVDTSTRPGSGNYNNSHGQHTTRALMSTHVHKYNKEQYLQANCQFVVRADADYGCYLGDPDLLVDWPLVEMIRVSSNETIACPICLYPPTAGKITRCGHIFCWTCILHYLALSDKPWRKCPICYESIHKKDLKSVECINKEQFSVGQDITFQLMKREKGSLIPCPVDQFQARAQRPILDLSEEKVDTVYSKLLKAQIVDVEKIIRREYEELQSQVIEFRGCPELCFVEQALESLATRKSCLTDDSNVPGNEVSAGEEELKAQTKDATAISEATGLGVTPETEKEPLPDEADKCEENLITVEDLFIDSACDNNPAKYFYFYQSSDGQQIYLHGLNVRMLERTYGSLEKCPLTLTGKILEKESGSMTQELRKRLRYMQHVPVTCQLEVVELELGLPIISEEAANAFSDQVKMRQRRRAKMEREEKKRERKIEEVQMRQFGRTPAPNLRIESHYHFPECGDLTGDFPVAARSVSPFEEGGGVDFSTSRLSSRSGSPLSERPRSPTTSTMAALDPDYDDNQTFAQMLRDGKSVLASSAWPTVGGERSSAEPVPTASGACSWVQTRRQRQPSVTVDSETEAYAFSPPAKHSFSIAEAIEAAAKVEKADQGQSRKKKKKPHKLLFATGIQCSVNPGN